MTGQWHDYQHWLEALVTYTPDQLEELSERAKLFMLSWLPENAPILRASSNLRSSISYSSKPVERPTRKRNWRIPPWSLHTFGQTPCICRSRPDEAHRKCHRQGIGDIDAWDGRKLTISVEVTLH